MALIVDGKRYPLWHNTPARESGRAGLFGPEGGPLPPLGVEYARIRAACGFEDMPLQQFVDTLRAALRAREAQQ